MVIRARVLRRAGHGVRARHRVGRAGSRRGATPSRWRDRPNSPARSARSSAGSPRCTTTWTARSAKSPKPRHFAASRIWACSRSLVSGADALLGLHRGDWVRAAACAEEVLTGPELSSTESHLATDHAGVDSRPSRPTRWFAVRRGVGLPPNPTTSFGAAWCGPRAPRPRGWRATTTPPAPKHKPDWRWLPPTPTPGWSVTCSAGRIWPAHHRPPIGDPVTPYHLEIRGDWHAAAAEWTRRGCSYDAAIAQLGGDIDAVQAALGTFRRLGARAAARRAQQRLAQLRGRTPDLRRKDTTADPHGLTKRQRDVLELLAAGHSDAEIAAALCISPKTANAHVCAIMAKLGVHNRTQAAAYAMTRSAATK